MQNAIDDCLYYSKMNAQPLRNSFRNILINVSAALGVVLTLFMLYISDVVSFATFKLLALICLVLFVIVPFVYKNSYSFQRAVVFLNFVNVPSNANYENPESYGLYGAKNLYITTDENVKLGVWQILPENHTAIDNDTDFFENALNNGKDVVIYNHGNGGCRLTSHRIETYKMLRKHFHVIAFDYRSYGDSSKEEPSEDALVRDCMFVYKWVASRAKGNVFVWGHSLGTSLATHAVANLQQEENVKQVAGLVLEAPFNNMREEISEFPLARMFRSLPWFAYTVVEPMQENNFKFETDKYICDVDAAIMILHAVDDAVVPFKLGRKLYESAMKCRRDAQGPVIFHEFDASQKLGHKYISRGIGINEKIGDFIFTALDYQQHVNA